MHRPRSTSCLLVALAALAAIAGACSGSSEQKILQQYFQAAKLRDSTTLSNIATVRFNPDRDGIVQSFTVTSVGDTEKRQLRLRELKKTHDGAKAADDEFSKRKKAYQDANRQAIDRIIRGERMKTAFKGKDLEVQTAWTKWREEMAQHAKRVDAARSQLAAIRGTVEASVFDARRPVDVTAFDAEVSKKEVTIAAQVRTPAGQVVPKTLVVTVERANLKNDDREVNGRWIITGIRDAGASAPQTSQ